MDMQKLMGLDGVDQRVLRDLADAIGKSLYHLQKAIGKVP